MDALALPPDFLVRLNQLTGGCSAEAWSVCLDLDGPPMTAIRISWGPPSWGLAYAIVLPKLALEQPEACKAMLDAGVEKFRLAVEGCAEKVRAAAHKKPKKRQA